MNPNSLQKLQGLTRWVAVFLLTAFFWAGQPNVVAQITTSGLSGRVVDERGAPVANANVIIVHEPTATRSAVSTRGNGTFTVRGLRPGGPYTVSVEAPGFVRGFQQNVFLDLGAEVQVAIALQSEEVMELDAFEVIGSASDRFFASDRFGAGSQMGSQDIAAIPVGDRSLNSLLRLDPRITFNRDPSDRSFSAGGASNRYNSILIDGVSASDPFGLNSNNTAAERNVVPLDSIEAVSVSTSPYDVRRGGFTGASVNAVTRRGGNEFSGSVYFTYRDQRMVQTELERIDGSVVRVPDFKERTFGLTLGGPIIQDKLFFFVAFERVREDRNPPSLNNFPTSAALNSIITQARAFGMDPGEAFESVDQQLEDDNILARIDWEISQDHRFTFRYNTVSSSRPTFPGYGGNNISFSSRWYDQEIDNTSYIAQLFSTWSADFSTEFSVSYSEYRSEPKFLQAQPEVTILNVPLEGTNQLGTVTLGTERSRHFNLLEVDTWTTEFLGTYELNFNNTLSFGYQLEHNTIFNAFVQDWFGTYEFNNVEQFLAAGTPGWTGRFRHQFERPGFQPAAEFREANHGFFVQNTQRVNDRLTLNYGVRIDVPDFGDRPDYNAAFETAFGFANNETYNGQFVIQPRVGFNLKLDDQNLTQIRGGAGLFYGRMPRVWMSNSYSNTGLNFQSVDVRNAATPAFSGDAFNQPEFDPAARAMQVVALDPDFEVPSSWKATLGLDRRLGDYVFTAETELSWVNKDVLFTNINRRVGMVAPDGREMFSGVLHSNFVPDTIFLTNTNKGYSRSFLFSLERPRQDDGWYWRLSYVNSVVREVQYGTSSVARSNWAGRMVLNPGEDVLSRGELEVRHRFLGVLRKDFELFKGSRTSVSLLYEGRSGLPYSLRFGNDVNGDGVNNNDLIYVPFRNGDPLVRFDSPETEATFFRIVDSHNLAEGQVVSAGSNRYPFVHQFDLSLNQEFSLPGWRHKFEIGLDILNVGNLLNRSWGVIRGSNSFFVKSEIAVNGTFDAATNQYVYSRANANLADRNFNPHGGRGEPSSSRWTGMLTVRYRF